MEKELFIALCDLLKSKVPELQWVDTDQGQLNVSERPPVAFPCCLVEMSYPQCANLTGGTQRIQVRFQLRVAFNVCTLQRIHKTLQGWNYGRRINPMTRVSVTPESRSNGLKVYRAIYESAFMD